MRILIFITTVILLVLLGQGEVKSSPRPNPDQKVNPKDIMPPRDEQEVPPSVYAPPQNIPNQKQAWIIIYPDNPTVRCTSKVRGIPSNCYVKY